MIFSISIDTHTLTWGKVPRRTLATSLGAAEPQGQKGQQTWCSVLCSFRGTMCFGSTPRDVLWSYLSLEGKSGLLISLLIRQSWEKIWGEIGTLGLLCLKKSQLITKIVKGVLRKYRWLASGNLTISGPLGSDLEQFLINLWKVLYFIPKKEALSPC